MTPRMWELTGRMYDAGMLERYDFSRQVSGPLPQQAIAYACINHLRLVSATLGVAGGISEGHPMRAWISNLPLAESLLNELYGDLKKFRPDVVVTISLISERAARLGYPIDRSSYRRFSDVSKGHWADDSIHRMRELGILKGYPDNTFRM